MRHADRIAFVASFLTDEVKAAILLLDRRGSARVGYHDGHEVPPLVARSLRNQRLALVPTSLDSDIALSVDGREVAAILKTSAGSGRRGSP